MAALVTIAEAKVQLRIPEADTSFDADIEAKVEIASEIVLDYIEQLDSEWTEADAPYVVKGAVLIQLAHIFHDREQAGIPQGVKDLLRRYRDPALA